MTETDLDLANPVQACPLARCSLDVSVVRSDTRTPIPGAVVEIEETGATRTIGAAGTVSFEDVSPRNYTARVARASLEGGHFNLPGSASASVAAGARALIEIV